MDIYGSKVLLCTELSHKLINAETVLELIERLYNQTGEHGYKERCFDYLIGLTVMTNYNNKTYRIDDIAWEMKPADSFDKRGVPITFVDYYRVQYNIRIKVANQPLLVSKPKLSAKDKAMGKKEPGFILLVPELCAVTGL